MLIHRWQALLFSLLCVHISDSSSTGIRESGRCVTLCTPSEAPGQFAFGEMNGCSTTEKIYVFKAQEGGRGEWWAVSWGMQWRWGFLKILGCQRQWLSLSLQSTRNDRPIPMARPTHYIAIATSNIVFSITSPIITVVAFLACKIREMEVTE